MRRLEQVERIRRGVLALFAPVVEPPVSEWAPGHLRLSDEEVTARFMASDIGVLDEDGFPVDCPAVAATTEAGDVLLVDIRSRRRTGGNLDVASYSARGLIVDVDLEAVDDDKVTAAQLTYHGMRAWIPNAIYHEESIEEEGTHRGWRAELR